MPNHPKTNNNLSEQATANATQPIRRLLSVYEAAEWLGMSRSWLQKGRVYGYGPVATMLGRRVLYDARDLERYLATRKQANTSAAIGSNT
jgi:hypothetical protein